MQKKDPAVQKPQECQKHLAVWQDHGELNMFHIQLLEVLQASFADDR